MYEKKNLWQPPLSLPQLTKFHDLNELWFIEINWDQPVLEKLDKVVAACQQKMSNHLNHVQLPLKKLSSQAWDGGVSVCFL